MGDDNLSSMKDSPLVAVSFHSRSESSSGHSILELLLVLSAVSSLGLATVGNWHSSLTALRLRAEVDLLQNAVQEASTLALRRNQQVTLLIEGRSVELKSEVEGTFWRRTLPDGLQVKVTQPLEFYPSGAARPSRLLIRFAGRECSLRVSLRAQGVLTCTKS